MSLIDDARLEVGSSIQTLRRRYGSTTDEPEKEAILATIEELNGILSELNQAGLLEAAGGVGDAAAALENAVGAARTGPFDGYLAAIEEHLRDFGRISGALHGREALETAPESEAAPATPRSAARRGTRGQPREASAPLPSTDYAALEGEYKDFWDACRVRPERAANVAYYMKRLNRGRPIYEAVGAELGGIPWAFVGVIHAMEAGFDFTTHLHNGDPLAARTVHVPKDRPKSGQPPFTWRQSAEDALELKGFHTVTDWSIPRMLHLLEKYNGFGYRRHGVPTPYLWSFSNLYQRGKYVRDGRFDPDAVSQQCGAALMLQAALSDDAPRVTRGTKRSVGKSRTKRRKKNA